MTTAGGSSRERVTPQGSTLLRLRLPALAGSVPVARRAVRDALAERAPRRAREAELLVSELVGNSVRHAGLRPADEIEVIVVADGQRVHITVCDQGPGFAVPPLTRSRRRPAEPQTGGYGLVLLAELADDFGFETADGAKVWFTLDLRGRGMAS